MIPARDLPVTFFLCPRRSRDGAVVRALASHQCGPGSIPARYHMWVEFVVGSRPCSEGCSPVFLPPQKPTLPNSNSIGNSRATGLSVARLLCVTLVKHSWFGLVCAHDIRGILSLSFIHQAQNLPSSLYMYIAQLLWYPHC